MTRQIYDDAGFSFEWHARDRMHKESARDRAKQSNSR